MNQVVVFNLTFLLLLLIFHTSRVLSSVSCSQVRHSSAPAKTFGAIPGIKRTFEADQSRSQNKFEFEAPQ